MISYYELLKKVEEGDIPEKIKVHLTPRTSRIYTADYDGSSFSHYFIDGDTNEEYHHYLSECFLESDMFDKNIEIIEEENKKCTVETCCIGIEGLSKALLKIKDDMKSIYENKVEILEEKKIPEKLIPTSLKGIDNLDEKIEIAHIDTISVIETLNQVIDYLKSKGDK